MLKRICSIILLFSMMSVLVACDISKISLIKGNEEGEVLESGESMSDYEPETKEPVAEIISPLHVEMAEHIREDYVELKKVYFVNRQSLRLPQDEALRYPLLAKKLEETALEQIALLDAEETSFIEQLEYVDVYDEYFNGYASERNSYVKRADDKILSVYTDTYSFYGGVHPDYGVEVLNLNPTTGEEVHLDDIVNDMEKTVTIIKDRLEQNYDEEIFFDDLDVLFEDISNEDYLFVMDYKELIIYFPTYVLAPHVAGTLTVSIGLTEIPGLIKDEYLIPLAGGYAMPLEFYKPISLSGVTDDNAENSFMLGYSVSEDGIYNEVNIDYNGTTYFCSDLYSVKPQAYLVCTKENEEYRDYLYLFVGYEDLYNLAVLTFLNGEIQEKASFEGVRMSGEYIENIDEYGSFYQEVLLNPLDFNMSTTITLLGYLVGEKNYYVDALSGVPCSGQDYILYEGYELVTKTELEAVIEETGETVILSEDSLLLPQYTDGLTFMAFETQDGRTCRIDIEGEHIQGKTIEECFEEMYY